MIQTDRTNQTSRNELVAFLDDYLQIATLKDYSYNGLQVEGRDEIRKVAVAVDAGRGAFKEAARVGADMLIVHHGLFWKGGDPRLSGLLKRRLDVLLDNKISLYAAHLPLDRHELIGNNASLLKIAGLNIQHEMFFHETSNYGWCSAYESPQPLSEIVAKFGPDSHLVKGGSDTVKTIAALSGAASYEHIEEAAAAGADLFITGEKRDFYQLAHDLNISILYLGHNASETHGVRNLAGVIADRFSIETIFLDIPTGL